MYEGWATGGLANRRNAAQAIVGAVADNPDEKQLSFFTEGNGSRSAAQLGWDCDELVIRSGTSNVEQEEALCESDKKATSGHVLTQTSEHVGTAVEKAGLLTGRDAGPVDRAGADSVSPGGGSPLGSKTQR